LNVMRKDYITTEDILVRQGRSVFENRETLSVKKAFINALEQQANDRTKSVPERIGGMKEFIKNVNLTYTSPSFFRSAPNTVFWIYVVEAILLLPLKYNWLVHTGGKSAL